MRGGIITGIVVAVAATVACSDLPSGAETPFSLTFDVFPSPSIVLGDTLRDTSGVVAAPVVTVFNGQNGVIANPPLGFILLDSASVVRVDDATHLLISTGAGVGTVRVVANVNGLQSEPRTIAVVTRPDSVAIGVPPDTLRYSFSDTTANLSAALQVRVLHREGAVLSGVGPYLVRFALEDIADTAIARLVDDQKAIFRGDARGRTHIDTTATDGSAARNIYLRPNEQIARPVDSLVVLATVRYRQTEIAGSPVRIVLMLKPKVVP